MDLSKFLILMGLCVLSLVGVAQDRYMVFFKDKAGTSFSTSQPLEFLSQRAIDRREKHGVRVSEEDLPVNSSYVEELDNAGADVYFASRWMNAALVQMDGSLEATVLALPSVSSIEYVALGSQLSYVKEDYSIAENFNNPTNTTLSTDTQNEMIGADQMHTDGFDGDGVLIAVFDGGFEGVNTAAAFQHLHDNDQIIEGLDFVTNTGNPYRDVSSSDPGDHGTRVLACLAGEYGSRFIGTAPDADYILAITEEVDTEYRIEEYNWLLAAEYADSAGVDIISSSLGYTYFDDPSMDYAYPNDFDGETTVISRAANMAGERGILVVNSAGNDGNNSWKYVGAPADSRRVLAVGAVTASESKVGFSSFGPSGDGRIKPDVAAMGASSVLVNKLGEITTSSGTSFSAPIMAGFSAGIIQKFPTLKNDEIIKIIQASSNQYSNPDNELGYGIPEYSMVSESSLTLRANDVDQSAFSIYPNPFIDRLTIKRQSSEAIKYSLMSLDAKTVLKGKLSSSEQSIDFDNGLEPGLYFLQIQMGSTIESFKLLKK